MLFENPAVAAKLPFPYNVPPPIQAAAAAVPSLRFQTPIKAFACLAAARYVSPVNTMNMDAMTYTLACNPIENSGLIDQHSRDLHSALVATINNSVAVNGAITPAAVTTNSPLQNKNVSCLVQQQTQQQQQQSQQQLQQQQQQQINALNGTINLNNSAKSTSSGRSTPNNCSTDPAPGKLFVGGLSWQTSSEKLKEYFNMFGTVTDVLIMKDPVTQRSRGFGFITFKEPNSVDKVLKVPIHTLDGKKIDPKHATPKNRPRQANKTKKIFVGGVSQETSADEVKAYFGQFGNVEETVMLMDQQTKRHRGFGFVTFENEDVVDRVCEIHFHTIKNKKVECKKAQPKEAVTPAAQLLQKRLMFGTLGVRLPTNPGQLVGGPGATQTVAAVNPLALLQSQQAAQAHAAQAAMMHNPFSVQNTAAAVNSGYGKLLATYPQTTLHSLRYAPYPIPASAAAAVAAAQQHQQHHHHQQQQNAVNQHTANQATNHAAVAANTAAHAANSAAHVAAAQQAALVASNPMNAHAAVAAAATGNPYQSYALANVDMSSFQGVDWGSMYGMGII
ncbi:RNA-binding protein Musashi homolog Rbp6 isoform X2 [Episyrphus balteatus]|uniref:RNA-binding protein Musashi homolog Rbp6 isoform X2 n=1 Tax=Episyrphus balteatus TaxID=286459 RepID=UPI0024868957|nr:RNA-binding protein Musashi homolog Rbp6 isoform X2 [Episyrphus balteatus]